MSADVTVGTKGEGRVVVKFEGKGAGCGGEDAEVVVITVVVEDGNGRRR